MRIKWIICCAVVLAMASGNVLGSVTYQEWTFDSYDTTGATFVSSSGATVFADVDKNPYGDPEAVITVDGIACGSAPGWYLSFLGRTGVWASEHTTATLVIPNSPVTTPNSYKDIWLTMGFRANLQSVDAEVIATLPTAIGVEDGLVVITPDDGWYKLSVHWRIYPNPENETIFLSIRDSGADIDYITVSTVCVPEPASLCLLGLGALVSVISRKR